MNDNVIVTFYLVSGKSVDFNLSDEKFKELMDSLKTSWETCQMIGPEFGLNFGSVTHYEIKK